jgi:hypothetical protein
MSEWSQQAGLQDAMFQPLHALIVRLPSNHFPTLNDFNRLLDEGAAAIKVHAGHSLRFVPQQSGKLAFESQYEPRCYLTGEVQTRENNWHDLLNALVWLTFPKAKAAINARHYLALQQAHEPTSSQRGAVRDTNTLMDESGVIVACANPELAQLLRDFHWCELFWQRRAEVRQQMGFYLFGHGLYEKAIQPYIGITGQGIIVDVAAEFFTWSHAAQLAHLDEKLATFWTNDKNCRTTRELNPVPLLGVPGWCAENNDASFYENTAYFRPGRRSAA